MQGLACSRQALRYAKIQFTMDASRHLLAPTVIDAPRCLLPVANTLGEGPHWSVRDGVLYWVDILQRRLYRWIPGTESPQHWTLPEVVSAVCERSNAPELLLSLRHGFALFDPQRSTTAITQRVQPEAGIPGNRFNDAKCDNQGRYWAGSMDFDASAATGALYRLDPDGQCTRHVQGLAVINGPTWSLDGRTLYLCDSARGDIRAYEFDAAQGKLGRHRLWLHLQPQDGLPDGLCTDAAGRIWLAHWQGGCVTCHYPQDGAELLRISLPVSQVTSCAFGGPDLQTLFITTASVGLDARQLALEPLAGGLFAVRVSVPGLPPRLYEG
jgi:xylono-1,5-lactonase